MLHNVVLVSAVQQGESAVSVHISRPSKFIILEVRFFYSSSATRYGDVFFFFFLPLFITKHPIQVLPEWLRSVLTRVLKSMASWRTLPAKMPIEKNLKASSSSD